MFPFSGRLCMPVEVGWWAQAPTIPAGAGWGSWVLPALFTLPLAMAETSKNALSSMLQPAGSVR